MAMGDGVVRPTGGPYYGEKATGPARIGRLACDPADGCDSKMPENLSGLVAELGDVLGGCEELVGAIGGRVGVPSPPCGADGKPTDPTLMSALQEALSRALGVRNRLRDLHAAVGG